MIDFSRFHFFLAFPGAPMGYPPSMTENCIQILSSVGKFIMHSALSLLSFHCFQVICLHFVFPVSGWDPGHLRRTSLMMVMYCCVAETDYFLFPIQSFYIWSLTMLAGRFIISFFAVCILAETLFVHCLPVLHFLEPFLFHCFWNFNWCPPEPGESVFPTFVM